MYLSKDATDICLASLSTSTNSQYDKHLATFKLFCQRTGESDHLLINVTTGIEFLTEMFKDGKSYSTINSAGSALSNFVCLRHFENVDFGKHPLTVKFMKGVYKLKPPVPKYTATWDVTLVLNHLRTVSNESCSLKELSLKCVMLLALCSGQRIQTLAALSLAEMISDEEKRVFGFRRLLKTSRPGKNTSVIICKYRVEPSICPVATLDKYIERTKTLRTGDDLFISFQKPHNVVSKQTLARWVVTTLRLCNINSKFTAHSTRSASTSKAALSIDVNIVMGAAGWSREKTFSTFYKRTVVEPESFGNSVLSID